MRGLVIINVVLALVLAAVWGSGPGGFGGSGANAQPGAAPGQPRPRGQYLVVSGRLNGMPANAIYLLDTANQEMVALRWERSRNDLIGLGYRSVSDDGKAAGGGR